MSIPQPLDMVTRYGGYILSVVLEYQGLYTKEVFDNLTGLAGCLCAIKDYCPLKLENF